MRKQRAVVAIVKEPPSNFCGKCRQWIVSDEAVNVFSEVDGVPRRVRVWFCSACRGDVPAGEVEEKVTVECMREPLKAADVSKEEHRGPFRAVVPGTYVANRGGKSGRAQLVCGHRCGVFAGSKRWRCTKCKPKKGVVS